MALTNSEALSAVKMLRPEIDAALLAVAAKHGLDSLKLGAITYSADGFTAKLEAVFDGGLTAEQKTYDNARAIYGLPARGFTFKTPSGKRHTVMGLRRTRVVTTGEDGRSYLFNVRDILAQYKVTA